MRYQIPHLCRLSWKTLSIHHSKGVLRILMTWLCFIWLWHMSRTFFTPASSDNCVDQAPPGTDSEALRLLWELVGGCFVDWAERDRSVTCYRDPRDCNGSCVASRMALPSRPAWKHMEKPLSEICLWGGGMSLAKSVAWRRINWEHLAAHAPPPSGAGGWVPPSCSGTW